MSPTFVRSCPRAGRVLAVAVPAAIAAGVAAAMVLPGGSAQAAGPPNAFTQTNLVSDLSNQGAKVVDPNLKNAWGLAMTATSPLWVANNNSDTSTIYSIPPGGTTVTKAGLTVDIPGGRTSTGDSASPTGQVANTTSNFVVTSSAGSGPAVFIFSSESGQITAWNPTADPATAGVATASLVFSSPTAVYKGLAIASTDQGTFLYASNFHDGTVDVFNSQFQPVHLAGTFQDPFLPSGYAPFGIQNINGLIYVTYALQDAAKHDDVPGIGHGFIDVYTNNGFLVERLASRGELDSPWGLAMAPQGFGPFGGQLLVGNFRNGLIHAYGLFSGRPHGTLLGADHKPIQIDHLWALTVGTASTGGTGTLLFSAGINDEQDGLIGSINPAP
jgi:uncharacterized protein (TIGR03118 family)